MQAAYWLELAAAKGESRAIDTLERIRADLAKDGFSYEIIDDAEHNRRLAAGRAAAGGHCQIESKHAWFDRIPGT